VSGSRASQRVLQGAAFAGGIDAGLRHRTGEVRRSCRRAALRRPHGQEPAPPALASLRSGLVLVGVVTVVDVVGVVTVVMTASCADERSCAGARDACRGGPVAARSSIVLP
jgi:hypothetical protein